MTGRCLFFTLLSVGCAAAVPAAHVIGGGHDAHHAWSHASHGEEAPSPDTIRAHVDAALDALGLAPETRAEAKALLEPHVEKALALHAKFASGELGPEAASAEHERIMADAKSDLAKVLTAEQIQKFVDSLHLHGGGGRGE
jgi:Spy/CpxP family protein refolding chaperone